MIKILAPGTRNKITCDFCGAVLQYDKEDVNTVENFSSYNEYYTVRYIVCPQCKYKINLERRDKSEISINKTN